MSIARPSDKDSACAVCSDFADRMLAATGRSEDGTALGVRLGQRGECQDPHGRPGHASRAQDKGRRLDPS